MRAAHKAPATAAAAANDRAIASGRSWPGLDDPPGSAGIKAERATSRRKVIRASGPRTSRRASGRAATRSPSGLVQAFRSTELNPAVASGMSCGWADLSSRTSTRFVPPLLSMITSPRSVPDEYLAAASPASISIESSVWSIVTKESAPEEAATRICPFPWDSIRTEPRSKR